MLLIICVCVCGCLLFEKRALFCFAATGGKISLSSALFIYSANSQFCPHSADENCVDVSYKIYCKF